MIFDFVDFVVSGRFGTIEPGCSRHQIKEIFGHPPQYSHSRKWRNVIYKYGDVEFRFYRLALGSVALNVEKPGDALPELPPGVELRNWRPAAERTVSAVESWLRGAGVAWKLDPDEFFTNEYQLLYVTTNHVELVFRPNGPLVRVVAVYDS